MSAERTQDAWPVRDATTPVLEFEFVAVSEELRMSYRTSRLSSEADIRSCVFKKCIVSVSWRGKTDEWELDEGGLGLGRTCESGDHARDRTHVAWPEKECTSCLDSMSNT